MIPPPILQQVGTLLLEHDWIFAKTMPQNPHWYTLRKHWKDDQAFVSVVEKIRQYGYREMYAGRPYTVLSMNGMKYWTMGAPLSSTILINRKVLTEGESLYDPIAPLYDHIFDDEASRQENAALVALVGDVRTLSVLDIGCGTGFFLDHFRPHAYTGIDPSFAMLACLKAKHPDYAAQVLACPLEAFVGGGYDLAVCLFGTANYIDASYVRAIPTLVRPGGRYLIMFFAPGYTPVTYTRTGYTQPVVTLWDPSQEKWVIIDGFHRYYVMKTCPDIYEMCHGLLPIVVLQKGINDRMASTVRHNRARGKHSIQGMSNLVLSMFEQGWSDQEICAELGMSAEEILRLKHITGFSKLFADVKYQKAWVTTRQVKIAQAYRE
jgi:SAM-dependent methyltransferase